jgi:hypothetical protein
MMYFKTKVLLPFFAYTPVQEKQLKEQKLYLCQSAEEAGKPITDLQAEEIVANALKDPNLPKGFRLDKPSDVIFQVPDFFVNRTVLDETLQEKNCNSHLVSIGEIKSKADREVFEELFGKQRNPMQTIIGATAKLSMLTRRNMFFTET